MSLQTYLNTNSPTAEILFNQYVEEGVDEHLVLYADFVSEGVANISMAASRGGLIQQAGTKLWDKAYKNPLMVAAMAAMATSAIHKYKQNKRLTTQFFAKTTKDRRFYEALVNDLMKTGHYKKIKQRYVDGGVLWVLRRDKPA